MQFRIDVDENWVVRVANLQTEEPVRDAAGKPFERKLRSVVLNDGEQDEKLFPQPPEEQLPAKTDPHYELCTTSDPDVIKRIYQSLILREADNVVIFGRYLFDTLLGEELWKAINDAAGNEPIELALNWKDDYQFNRLPWELMRSKDRFLAQEPEVAITRRVAGTKQTLAKISSPRVLFVVGSDLAKDKQIKPGAEYLGLLRSLKPAARLRLKTHLLLQASPRRIKAAIKSFKPTIVHFICHGIANPDEVFLKLMPDEAGGSETIDASGLLKILRPDPSIPLPQIVILNACYTASDYGDRLMKSGQVSSPMAVKLVEGDGQSPGVPIVVGMAGEVADQACRLFTRCFYEAILEGGEIAQSSAVGRRLGIIDEGLTDPSRSIDWALPTLFMSAGIVEPKLQIERNVAEEQWHAVAAEFAPPDYPAFCDRLHFFEWYDCLMASDPAELLPPQQHTGDLQLLAVSLEEKEKKGNAKAQLGRTWLLHQFAANAALDGHLPVLNTLLWIDRSKDDYPKDLPRLIDDFSRAMTRSSERFDLDFSAECLEELERVSQGANPDKLPSDVTAAYREDKSWDGPQVMFAALKVDLLRLLAAARKKLQPPQNVAGGPVKEQIPLPKLLLLVDDLHQMDKVTRPLLQFLSGIHGLRSSKSLSEGGPSAKADIRVICTYDLGLGLGEENTIISWLETAKGAREVPLRVFQDPEDRLAYSFFLSCWKKKKIDTPLSLEPKAAAPTIDWFFQNFSEKVMGIPSMLTCARATDFIETVLGLSESTPMRVLRKMNDDERLKLAASLKRGSQP